MVLITRLSIGLLVSLCLILMSRAAAAEISAGVATADITPPIGGRTTGYASAQPTDDVHDPLSGRVLVLIAAGTQGLAITGHQSSLAFLAEHFFLPPLFRLG